jgi:OOP family OmpA-OmpF porin
MKKKNLYVALFCMSLLSLDTSAQNRTYDGPNKMNTWSITGYGGITKFFGDLSQYNGFKRGDNEKVTGGWGLSINKQLSPLFGIQLVGSNGRLH